MEIVNLKASNVFEWLTETDKRINFLIGGRDSTKSWSIALHLLINKFFEEENKRILVVRKTRVAVKKSCFQLFLDLLGKYDCLRYVDINHTELEIKRKDNSPNSILFTGLDDVEKLKSIEQGNYIWVEEAIDITFLDFINLDILMRRETDGINQMFLSCNPMSALSWIKIKIVDKPDNDTAVHISTVDDNPFASDIDKKRLDRLKDEDFNLYKIFRLSQWGILRDIIYTFPTVNMPLEFQDVTFGIDFGFNNPSTVMRIYWIDGRAVWQEVFYRSNLTNTELINAVKESVTPEELSCNWYADTAEPARIEEFYKAGFNIYPADKSVKDGIDFCKTHVIGITKDSVNAIKERQSYSYKKDKDGNVIDEPVKFADHLMDAGRYGTYRQGQEATPNIIILGEN